MWPLAGARVTDSYRMRLGRVKYYAFSFLQLALGSMYMEPFRHFSNDNLKKAYRIDRAGPEGSMCITSRQREVSKHRERGPGGVEYCFTINIFHQIQHHFQLANAYIHRKTALFMMLFLIFDIVDDNIPLFY